MSLKIPLKCNKLSQGYANDHPRIVKRIFKNREKSIGPKGFEPAT